MKVLLRPSENICGYWSVNSGDSSYCRFSESLPFGNSQDMKQRFMYKDVRCVKVATCAKRVANLHVSRRLSPEGGEGGAWPPLAHLPRIHPWMTLLSRRCVCFRLQQNVPHASEYIQSPKKKNLPGGAPPPPSPEQRTAG